MTSCVWLTLELDGKSEFEWISTIWEKMTDQPCPCFEIDPTIQKPRFEPFFAYSGGFLKGRTITTLGHGSSIFVIFVTSSLDGGMIFTNIKILDPWIFEFISRKNHPPIKGCFIVKMILDPWPSIVMVLHVEFYIWFQIRPH